MSAIDRNKIACAMQDVNRAMSMLGLIEAALRQEEDFQERHVNRPLIAEVFIPSLGEVIDTVLACRSQLNHCWEDLARREGDL
jgi:hypothetical protein